MADIKSIPPVPQARRVPIVIDANISRVILRPYIPPTTDRIYRIADRVLNLDETRAKQLLDSIMHDFSHRHRYFREALKRNFDLVSQHLPDNKQLSEEMKYLIGSYFTAEYSVEAAALFNPSIVSVPNLENDSEDSTRFIMSFRAVGEGHISSIEFRSGIIDSNNDIYFDAQSQYVRTPRIHTDLSYDRELFRLKLKDMGAGSKVLNWLLGDLPEQFTFSALEQKISNHYTGSYIRSQDREEATEMAMWLSRSNYEVKFRRDHQISERVIFPVSESEKAGIEDARFVRFVEDDGTIIYYATYTAYNGETILPQLIETSDFITFKISTLNGKQAHGKGMALFPRKINGKFVMLSRQDGENNAIMFSENVHFWKESTIIQTPMFPYEFFQIGNGGSPIETPEGWLVITHGVGPLRTYSLSITLLNLDDPTKVMSRIDEPILVPNQNDREGYVPNVVYSCGSMIVNDQLVIAYASADQRCGIAILNVPELMARLRYNRVNGKTL